MVGNAENDGGRRASRRRIAVWAVATFTLLMLPLVAMRFTNEVNWGVGDFVFAGALLFGTGLAYELVARKSGAATYRAAAGIALAAAFILVWVNAAVGIIGSEDEIANLMYIGVLAVGIIGAIVARFQPHGMARALFAMALAQALVAVIALVAGLGSTDPTWPLDILGVTGVFIVLFAGSAWLFEKAARGGPERSAKDAG